MSIRGNEPTISGVRKKRILIVSYPKDLHARAVAHAIRSKGHSATEVFFSDFPTVSTISLTASNQDGHACLVESPDGCFDAFSEHFDTVWVRRVRRPWLPPTMHPGDREVADRQCDRVLQEVLVALDGPGVFWVNDLESEKRSLLKVFQLRAALKAGLTIPDTLVTNDPIRIREFIGRYGGTVIHKLLQHASWRLPNSERVLVCYTSPLTCGDLPKEAVLRLCPGIFQPLLAKSFEVRVACFGTYLMALRIESQTDERARLDWRAGQWFIDMRPYDLPSDVAAAIRRFLSSTGLASASLDFVVMPEGEHIFLEANPPGQFLWMEDRAGLPTLDAMSSFLISGTTDFQFEALENSVTFVEFKELWEKELQHDTAKHVLASETMSVPEGV